MFDFSVKKGIEVQRSWIKTVVPYGNYRLFCCQGVLLIVFSLIFNECANSKLLAWNKYANDNNGEQFEEERRFIAVSDYSK